MPLHIIDTAGLRQTTDKVEQIGVQRALQAIDEADRILLVVDSNSVEANNPFALWPEFLGKAPPMNKVTLIRNKIDLSGEALNVQEFADGHCSISLSAKQGQGIEQLREHLKQCMGYQQASESTFSARRRHLQALQQADNSLTNGYQQLIHNRAGELLAEDLRQAQQALGEITGEFSADDLLGRIFSSFCIGK